MASAVNEKETSTNATLSEDMDCQVDGGNRAPAAIECTIKQQQQQEEVYGGCEGPNAAFVKLIASDNHEFIISKKLALISQTITNMLSMPAHFGEDEVCEVKLREFPSHVLEKICMYFAHKDCYTDSTDPVPEFVIADEIGLELLMAANFLVC